MGDPAERRGVVDGVFADDREQQHPVVVLDLHQQGKGKGKGEGGGGCESAATFTRNTKVNHFWFRAEYSHSGSCLLLICSVMQILGSGKHLTESLMAGGGEGEL